MWPPNEGMPLGRPCTMLWKICGGVPPYFHSASISGGPMPPPPPAWQPLQLYQRYRRLPWFTAYALPSYGPVYPVGWRTPPVSAAAGWLALKRDPLSTGVD